MSSIKHTIPYILYYDLYIDGNVLYVSVFAIFVYNSTDSHIRFYT